jgi:hypothetical protein
MGGALLAWLALLLIRGLHGHPVPAFSIAYNLPMSAVFGALGTALIADALASRRLGGWVLYTCGDWGRAHLRRLVQRSVDASGHMVWALLIAIECLAKKRPPWFTGVAWALVLYILGLKSFVLGGRSGLYGLIVGPAVGSRLPPHATTGIGKPVSPVGEAEAEARLPRGKGSMTCVLRAIGSAFDVDAFLAESEFGSPTVFRRGEPRLPPSPGRPTWAASGFNLTVSPASGDLDFQIQETVHFLVEREDELRRLGRFPGVEEVCLDFGLGPWDGAVQAAVFPSDLLWRVGALDIDLVVSRDPVSGTWGGTPES